MWTLKGPKPYEEWYKEVNQLASMEPVRNADTAQRVTILLTEIKELQDMGWQCQRIKAVPLTGQDTLTFTVLARSASETRTLVFTVRREHSRYSQPVMGAFIGELYVEPSDGTPPLRIPVDAEFAVHVTRDSPSDTVRALAIATDDELVTEYSPLNLNRAADLAMQTSLEELTDVLGELDGPNNLQRLDTQR